MGSDDAPTLLSPAKPSSAAPAAGYHPEVMGSDDAPTLLSPAKPSFAAPAAGYHPEVMGSRWSTLPDELLHLVLIRLSNMDRKSFESVCTSWRSVAIQTPPRREPPWLFMGCRDRVTLIYYSFWESRIIRLRISSEFNGWRCEGASHGWLIMTDHSESKLCLLNPITRARIDLPPHSWAGFRRINYMALSSDPATSSRAVVAVTSFIGDTLVCRVGDEHWRLLDNICMYSGTIAFHKGLLYAQYSYKTRMVIYGRDCRRSSVVGCSDYRSNNNSSLSFLIRVGEEEHQGEDLFQVIVHQWTFESARRCIVLKLVEDMDGGSPRWVQMKSLGGRALFVSKRYSELLTADDCAAMGLRGNLVYYWGQANLLKFSVEDGRIVGIGTPCSKICDCNCRPFWFNPSLPSRSENSLVCMD